MPDFETSPQSINNDIDIEFTFTKSGDTVYLGTSEEAFKVFDASTNISTLVSGQYGVGYTNG